MKLWHYLEHKKFNQQNKKERKIRNLEIVEIVLVQGILIDNQYQQKPEVLYSFTTYKPYTYLLSVEPSNNVNS